MAASVVSTLLVVPAVAERLRRAWRRGLVTGVEPCGYVLATAEHPVALCAFWPGRNTHPSPARSFRLDPEEHLTVRRRARRAGLAVVGIWHGHLVGPPKPSRADARGHGRFAPPWMLISGRDAAGRVGLRVWARGDPAWVEQPLREGHAAD